MVPPAAIDRVLAAVDESVDELVDFTADLIRIPTVNPPGEVYEDCARLIGDRLALGGFEVEYHAAEGRPEHTSHHPRVNVVGLRRGRALRPAVHL
ncbi:MAG: succinyl-diaminopimelate desuccinylase, partial [Acidobacteriota bacterium]|nr:succinyl-diaminopimelate desuccinylase [Acidobacteriota bacterium]